MNWGKKLLIVMGIFMIFIMTLGTIMIMDNEKDALIDQDYYEKGQAFDVDYKKRQAASDDDVIPKVVVNQSGVTISFTTQVRYKIVCKRFSDQSMDKVIRGFTEEKNIVQISKGSLQPGPWLLRIEFTREEKEYVHETGIEMP